jgi:hypothetical protein
VPAQLVEFRNYRLVPGGLDDFVEHFERRFLDSQAALGMDILGRFRVLDEADRFVWVRRYLDPAQRAASLAAFYGGPVWKEFGPRANELLVDHTDVHLLEPDPSSPDFPAATGSGDGAATSTVTAALFPLDAPDTIPPELTDAMTTAAKQTTGVTELGRLVTSSTANDFPRLPVHEDRPVALWLLSDTEAGEPASALATTVGEHVDRVCDLVRLAPTARSTLR